MSVLDLAFCPICHTRDSLARQTMQFESRTHVTYECVTCGTMLAWLGDEMWLEADRWSFQRVGRPEKADLLYRSMTVAELRKLAGEKAPTPAVLPGDEPGQRKPPPVWIEIPQAKKKAKPPAVRPSMEPEPLPDEVAPVEVERDAAPVEVAPVRVEPEPAHMPSPEPGPLPDQAAPVEVEREAAPVELEPQPAPQPVDVAPVVVKPEPAPGPVETEMPPITVGPEPMAVEEIPFPAEPKPQPVEVAPVRVEPKPAAELAAEPIPEPEPLPDQAAPAEVEREAESVEAATIKAEPAPVEERPVPEPAPAAAPGRVMSVAAEPEPLPAEIAPMATEATPPSAEAARTAIGAAGGPKELPVDRPRSKQRRGRRQPGQAQLGPPRRRSRGSPFLVISVGLVLLCLICSAAAMVIYSLLGNWPPAGGLPANPPASEAMPSEALVPTDALPITAAPSPTETAVPFGEAGAPEAMDDVDFQGVTDYQSSSGSRYLVGEVLNRTADTLRFVEVLATFYDGNGQIVGTGSTFAELSTIDPGSAAPFKLTAPSLPDLGRYELQVAYSTTTQPSIRLELMEHSGTLDGSGWYRITGEVRNPHDFAVRFPEVVATYYNATHEVVRVEVALGQVDPLEPGQSSPFEVVLTDAPADLQHYALQTEATQQ